MDMVYTLPLSADADSTAKEDADALVSALAPFIGQNDCDDLLHALVGRWKENELREKKDPFPGHVIPSTCDLTPVSTIEEVIQAVNNARQKKQVVRVAGAEHSPPDHIFPNNLEQMDDSVRGSLNFQHLKSEFQHWFMGKRAQESGNEGEV